MSNQRKNREMELRQTEKLLHNKGNDQQSGETACEKILANYASDKTLTSRISYKEVNSKSTQ